MKCPSRHSHTWAPLLAILALLAAAGCGGSEDPAPAPIERAETSETPAGVTAESTIPADAEQVARRIVSAARESDLALDRLQELCDGIGARPAGSAALEQSLDWASRTMRRDGLDSVTLEKVMVSVWERGEESAMLIQPGTPRPLAILGLGNSIGTATGGVTAPVVPVRDFAELQRLGNQVSGKIVLFNFPMTEQPNMFASYSEAVRYRWIGANRASKLGAEAILVRSLTTRSQRTPHTGAMKPYDADERPIPAAAVSIEDASMLQRLYDRGLGPVVRLTMGARVLASRPSANAIGELRGRERPDEIVVVGGHIDSWDVGTGAHDDGAGVVMAMEALRLLSKLDLRPRRTVRAVLFTNEERGLDGANAYRDEHRGELDRHVAALESDSGGFAPRGFSFQGADEAADRLERLLPLFSSFGPMSLRRGGSGADIGPIVERGVPGLGMLVDSTHYFDYHHTMADTFDKIVPAEFNDSVAAFTLMTWFLAEMPEPLPRAASKAEAEN